MRLKEIANMQDQLDLLCLIVNSTLTAIRQQAQMQPKQQARVAPKPKTARPKTIKPPKRPPYAAPPKPLPKPKITPLQQAKQQQANQAQLVNQINKSLAKTGSAPQQQMGPTL